jgi:hypothetical protein
MKKTVLLLLFILLAFSFTGCDQQTEPEETAEPERQQEQTVEEPEEEPAEAEPAPEDADEEALEPADDTNEAEPSAESPEVVLAKCMTEKGTKLYTATWCGHCQNQKEAFKEGLEYLDNVECAAMDGWSVACKDAGVKAVPAWVLPDGTMETGAMPLAKLASLTGCPYNS